MSKDHWLDSGRKGAKRSELQVQVLGLKIGRVHWNLNSTLEMHDIEYYNYK